MNIYKYYIKKKHLPKIFDNRRGSDDDLVLYAHTEKKDLAKAFEHSRNMKRFRVVKSKMSKKEYQQYARRSQEETLTSQEYLYFKKENGKPTDPEYVYLVLTYREMESLQFIMDSGIVKEFDFFCPGIFQDVYYDALRTIKYVDAFKTWMTEMESGALRELSVIMELRGDNDYDFGPMDIDYDEVEIFLSLFDSTL